jgi:hypothetical protein
MGALEGVLQVMVGGGDVVLMLMLMESLHRQQACFCHPKRLLYHAERHPKRLLHHLHTDADADADAD